MNLVSIEWDIDVLALSSIVHRDTYTSMGSDTVAAFRQEQVRDPSGNIVEVPIISGSSFRGVLRRIGEQLTAEILNYETALPVPAAHLLTNGGRLGKSANPMTDEQERTLKTLIPLIALFGGSASGRIMSGLCKVGNILPEIAELAHILPRPPSTALPAGDPLADESFAHLSDHRPNSAQPPLTDTDTKTSPAGVFGVETLPAGTRLQTWVRIDNATDIQATFLRDILNEFATQGHLGGRTATGHGRITAELHPDVKRGQLPDPDTDWAADLAAHRDDAIAALTNLT